MTFGISVVVREAPRVTFILTPRVRVRCAELSDSTDHAARAVHGAASLFLAEGAVRSGEHTTCDQHISLEEVSPFV